MKLLSGILPAMTMAVRVLNDVSQQDPLLTGSVALLTGLVLRELNDRRNAISLILQSLDFIDDARAKIIKIFICFASGLVPKQNNDIVLSVVSDPPGVRRPCDKQSFKTT